MPLWFRVFMISHASTTAILLVIPKYLNLKIRVFAARLNYHNHDSHYKLEIIGN
jgi:hypothetical protein